MKRNIIIAAALVALFLFGAGRGLAQDAGTNFQFAPATNATATPPVITVPQPVGTNPPAAPSVLTAPPTQPVAATTQNTITTTAPVKSETTISVGTIAGEVLQWIAAAFSLPIGALIVKILMDFLKKLGVETSNAMRVKLQDIIVNGLNSAAKDVAQHAEGKGQVQIQNEIAQKAIEYTQAHGAETIKALGLDPKSGDAVEAIRARIETAIADPAAPTPVVMQQATAEIAAKT